MFEIFAIGYYFFVRKETLSSNYLLSFSRAFDLGSAIYLSLSLRFVLGLHYRAMTTKETEILDWFICFFLLLSKNPKYKILRNFESRLSNFKIEATADYYYYFIS